jgi:hypothetical protein
MLPHAASLWVAAGARTSTLSQLLTSEPSGCDRLQEVVALHICQEHAFFISPSSPFHMCRQALHMSHSVSSCFPFRVHTQDKVHMSGGHDLLEIAGRRPPREMRENAPRVNSAGPDWPISNLPRKQDSQTHENAWIRKIVTSGSGS